MINPILSDCRLIEKMREKILLKINRFAKAKPLPSAGSPQMHHLWGGEQHSLLFCLFFFQLGFANEVFLEGVDDVSFECFWGLDFFGDEHGFFVDELAFLLVGLEGDAIEFEEGEMVGCGKSTDAGEVVKP